MYIDGEPILHVIDEATTFQSSAFLPRVDVSAIWNTFISIWCNSYVGFPENMSTDRGSVFVSPEWVNACDLGNVHLRHTGVESHSSLGIGERFHSPLRTIYKNLQIEHPSLPREVRLSMATHAMMCLN
jgi:hypothetical protein